MDRFIYNEVGCVVDTCDNCQNYDTSQEVLDLLNELAVTIDELELKAMAFEKISEFAYDMISKTLSEKLTDLDTMFAMRQMLGDLTKTMDHITDNLKDLE